MEQLTPAELAALIEAEPALVLLDVREAVELERACLPNVVHLPLGELVSRHGELDPEAPTAVICHHGIRSARACGFLATQGFERLINLRGGMEAWSSFDPSLPRY